MSTPTQNLPPSAQAAGRALSPVDSPGPESASRLTPIARTRRYRCVLLVEDEVTLRRILARNLTSRGIEVREAGTAQEAIDSVAAGQPDLLLLDINLPDLTGWDVMRELKRRGSEVPTIVLSAVRVNPNRLSEFHPLAYLPKPFPIDALLRLVLDGRTAEDAMDDEDT